MSEVPGRVDPESFYGTSEPRRSPRTLTKRAASKEPIVISDSSDLAGEMESEDELKDLSGLKISISKRDLVCLERNKCLNDAVINAYMDILASKADKSRKIGHTNTFFIDKLQRDGFTAAVTWAGIDGVRLDMYHQFLIPVATGFHWILIEVNFITSTINIYDSLGKSGTSIARLIQDFMKEQGILRKFQIKWPLVPKQLNYHDCGVFLLQYSEMIFENIPIKKDSFTQGDAKDLRQKFYDALVISML